MSDTVTIIIPVYNEAKHLAETLHSVINQSYTDIQIRVGDNASTDESKDIVNEFKTRDDRLELYEQQSNIPAAQNFKFLIDSVNTPYTFVIGGHDILKPDCIKQCMDKLKRDSAVAVYPEVVFFGSANKTQNPNSDIAEISTNKTQRFLKIIHNLRYGSAVYSLYKTDVLQKVDLNSFLGADLSWLLQVANQGSISSSGILGYQRREDRKENAKTKKKRYLNYVGLKSKDYSFYPMIRYIMHLMEKDEDISDIGFQKIMNALIQKYQISSLISPCFIKEITGHPKIKFFSTTLSYLLHTPKMMAYSLVRLLK